MRKFAAAAAAVTTSLMFVPRPVLAARAADERPAPPLPSIEGPGIVENAGASGLTAYARAGVLELGGFVNFTVAKDYSSFGFYPTIGWFFVNNVELTAIIGATHVSQTLHEEGRDVDASSTQLLLLGEPSFHVPFSSSLYGFLGVGFGLAHQARSPGAGAGVGFALAPRLGLNVMVGRSGVFTPAIQGIYQTTEAVSTPQGGAIAVRSTFGFQAGYTVMW